MTHNCSFLSDLALDGEVSFGESARESHAADFGAEERGLGVTPDAVVWPESTADVSAVLAAADERRVPVTPFAAGTSLEGNAVPARRGVSLDCSRMDAVLDVRADDFQIDVEPGVYGSAVDEAVADEGLFFPPLPSSGDISTVGGMIANDASGMKTVKYGEVADWVLELEVVLADGSVVAAGSRAAKTSSGYNLKDLFVGSEGTLGVVTRATLELAGRPEQVRGARALFPSLDAAAEAVFDAARSGVDVATIELVDEDSARMANAYTGTDLPDAPTVFLEFHADHGVAREIDFCREVFADHDCQRFETAADDAEMSDLWEAREDLAYAIQLWDPDLTALHPGDVTVPISAYPEMVRFVKSAADDRDLLVPCFGHAGDGNLHYSVLVEEDDPGRVEAAHELYEATVEKAIDLGGTATGEHGIGLGKRDFLEVEHGPETVEAMRRLKRAFDPRDTLNPGKVFPETEDGGRVRADDDAPPHD
ncbi:FAD-binding oxidoreductase [Halorussus caseinilyticus]|uniref:D-lactate dehydrogenase (cytochrome) n=1 Tax=Halorussus caseinilyticus TaxID=3034025 RepID=A0ABD5WPH7_9EURY|nr:FAD-linked oxidase C-terminal domain-containing protein [Halorussus sp. DT72]